ncbi:hypothetical protein [Peijinzhouia sedimentorum]
MPNKTQLSLFEPEIVPQAKLYYRDLSIHQKINFNANKCMAGLVYTNSYKYCPISGAGSRKQITQLTSDYFWHYRANAGGRNRLDAYLKSMDKKTLF